MYSEGLISRKKAAETLELTERQITRMRKEYERSGDEFVIHKNTERSPSNAINERIKMKILELHSLSEYEGVNHTHFQEILSETHKIKVAYTSLHRILTEAGRGSPKKKKQPTRRTRRKRKAHPGELVQIDASPFEWFGGDVKYAIHGAIDDATGDIVGLYMSGNECLFGYMEVMRQCILDFGVPQSLYSDCHSIFRSPKTDRLSTEEIIDGKTVNLTQFGRAMHELGVDIIHAKSPQAK
jgi:transposase